MKKSLEELQKIRGIGKVLAKRLVDAGHDTYEKLHALGEEGLRAVRGINPRVVESILSQAAELAESKGKERARRVEELRAAATTLRGQVEEIARGVKDRFADEVQGQGGRKLEKQVAKIMASFDRVEGKLEKRTKRAAKGLARAEARLAGLTEESVKAVEKGIRRARKALKRIIA
ncbi:MAG: helix-hairpin-helix domain-containing protein [Desulfuromonadales bacterium]|nr:MAG: helix-hairpin-helix domain-containing protein [Desulfuromonadales bacterium]